MINFATIKILYISSQNQPDEKRLLADNPHNAVIQHRAEVPVAAGLRGYSAIIIDEPGFTGPKLFQAMKKIRIASPDCYMMVFAHNNEQLETMRSSRLCQGIINTAHQWFMEKQLAHNVNLAIDPRQAHIS